MNVNEFPPRLHAIRTNSIFVPLWDPQVSLLSPHCLQPDAKPWKPPHDVTFFPPHWLSSLYLESFAECFFFFYTHTLSLSLSQQPSNIKGLRSEVWRHVMAATLSTNVVGGKKKKGWNTWHKLCITDSDSKQKQKNMAKSRRSGNGAVLHSTGAWTLHRKVTLYEILHHSVEKISQISFQWRLRLKHRSALKRTPPRAIIEWSDFKLTQTKNVLNTVLQSRATLKKKKKNAGCIGIYVFCAGLGPKFCSPWVHALQNICPYGFLFG